MTAREGHTARPGREPDTAKRLPEERESIWTLAAAPTVWAVHFLASYVTAAVWCARVAGRAGVLGDVRLAIAVFTAVALGAIGVVGWSGYRRARFGEHTTPHDVDTPEDRHSFLGFATLLLAALSAVAVVYVALTAVFIETCH